MDENIACADRVFEADSYIAERVVLLIMLRAKSQDGLEVCLVVNNGTFEIRAFISVKMSAGNFTVLSKKVL